MKKLFTLMLAFVAVSSFAQKTISTATQFNALYMGYFADANKGDWELDLYDASSNGVAQISIVSPDSIAKIGGTYEMDSVKYEAGVNNSGYVAYVSGKDTLVYSKGTLTITFDHSTKATDSSGDEYSIPYYKFEGTFTAEDGSTLSINKTLPCIAAVNMYIYQYFSSYMDYWITLQDDPDYTPESEEDKHKPNGTVKEYTFTNIPFHDDTTSANQFWQFCGYNEDSSVYISFSTKDGYTTIPGTYTMDDMLFNYTKIVFNKGQGTDESTINFWSGDITVTVKGDTKYLEAVMLGYSDNITYKIHISTDSNIINSIGDVRGTSAAPVTRKYIYKNGVVIENNDRQFDTSGRRIQ